MISWKKHHTALFVDDSVDNTSDFFFGEEAPAPSVKTPLGNLRLVEPRHSCWLAYATVDVTETHLQKVSRVRGVDALKPLSRYSFLLAVAPNFDAERAKRAVERVVEPPSGYRQLRLLKQGLKGRYPHWAIVRTPKGLLRPVSADTRTLLNKRVVEIEGKVVARGG